MSVKKRKRNVLGPLEEDVMRHLTAGDFLMSFLLSGRSTRAFYREANKRALARQRYERSVDGLQRRGLVTKRGDEVCLTEKGKELASILVSRTTAIDAPWKGSWWVVIYDIPVSLNPLRFELRRILIRAGFRKLQHSVWIHPHQCKELEIFVKSNPRIGTFVRYMEVQPFAHLETIGDWKKLPTG
ncbi:MAG: hypothetical protein Q8R25_02450 [bacterium]|nr:hypothetical protein [bacterium]